VEEVFSDAVEFFASGTAAGVTYFESLAHNGKEVVFGDGKMGEFSTHALKTLKGIQYGLIQDTYGWMVAV
jgi:branched-chain amino acid aminotransferase